VCVCVCVYVCVNNVQQNIISAKYKWDRYFVNEVKTQLRKKPLWGSQTQEFQYLEDKASTKTVTLTYPYADSDS
jgi:hypothetical protein